MVFESAVYFVFSSVLRHCVWIL